MTGERTPHAPGLLPPIAFGLLGLVCFFFASAASFLLMPECPSFSLFATDALCGRASYGSIGMITAWSISAALLARVVLSRRR